MSRIISPSKYLENVVKLGQKYHIGFGIKGLTSEAISNKEIQLLINQKLKSTIVTGKKGALKDNIKGKYVRKQPESKITVSRHIEYYSHRFEKEIKYDRDFNIWEKELLHKYNLELSRKVTPQGEIILHFPAFTLQNNESHYLKAGAAMNMAIQLGGYYMIYDSKFEPIIPVTVIKDKSILPPGIYGTIEEKLEAIDSFIGEGKDEPEFQGNSYRFALLRNFSPSEVAMGIGGFNDYLMFEYNNKDLVVLENLKSGNATYLFKLSKFNKEKSIDKQTARKEESFIDRIVHENMDDWNIKMQKYLR